MNELNELIEDLKSHLRMFVYDQNFAYLYIYIQGFARGNGDDTIIYLMNFEMWAKDKLKHDSLSHCNALLTYFLELFDDEESRITYFFNLWEDFSSQYNAILYPSASELDSTYLELQFGVNHFRNNEI